MVREFKDSNLHEVAVVIPAYNVAANVVEVINSIPKEVTKIFVVDDACTQGSGHLVKAKFKSPRVSVIHHETNQGVGGAMITGYRAVLEQSDKSIIVKLDGDGQMDASLISKLIDPIARGAADYTKGNRFDSIEDLEQMPRIRILGNAVLSLMSKFSSGYWNVNDPTNGFTAISREALSNIRLGKIRKTFFFESDMLFRLNLINAAVADVPIPARYGNEKSNLRISKVLREFPARHLANFGKRIIYRYYLREWSAGSLELPAGLLLIIFGIAAGLTQWSEASAAGQPATAGQVMIAALPLIVGAQLVLAFLNYDIASVPKKR